MRSPRKRRVPDLWDHQREAIELALQALEQGGAFGLWHDMRTGKCRTTLEILQRTKAYRTLVVCPKKVINVWPDEAWKYDWEGQVVPLEGSSAKRADTLRHWNKMSGPIIFVTNHEGVWREPLATALHEIEWDTLVVDEVHRLKAVKGRASRYLWSLAKVVPHRLALSGTPIPHSPLDAWPVYRILEPEGPFGHTTYTRFRIAYTRPAQYGEWRDRDLVIITGRGGELLRYKLVEQDRLNELMYTRNGLTIAHRVHAEDVLDLAEPLDIERYVELEPSAKKVYREMEREMVAELGGGGQISASNAMVAVLRLAQITGGSVRRDDGGDEVVSTAKQEMLKEMLEDSYPEPVVVFCRFHSDLDAVRDAARGDVLELSGRIDQLMEWKMDGRVLAVQIQAGGIGIDLSRARMAVFYSLGYSLSDHAQARARLVKDGLKTPPAFYYLLAKGTVDEDIMSALANREEIVGRVVDGIRARTAAR